MITTTKLFGRDVIQTEGQNKILLVPVKSSVQGDRTFRPVRATLYINSESANRQLPAHKPHPTNTQAGIEGPQLLYPHK